MGQFKSALVFGFAVLAVCVAGPAIADQLPIDGKYGNPDGCDYDSEQAPISDRKIIVTPQRVEFHESACDFLQVLTASYGRAVITALCSGEGEEWVSTYIVTPDFNQPEALHFRMQGGDESEFTVSKCD